MAEPNDDVQQRAREAAWLYRNGYDPNSYCQPGYCMVPGHPASHDERSNMSPEDRKAYKLADELQRALIPPVEACPECGSPLRFNKYGARWDCSNYGACENAGG
jgi:hypothetical protein